DDASQRRSGLPRRQSHASLPCDRESAPRARVRAERRTRGRRETFARLVRRQPRGGGGMTVSIVGLGYVGAVTAACLAALGLEDASGKRAGVDFGVGVNPEFLTEGQAVDDFMFPDRLVLGGDDERVQDALEELYVQFPPDVPRVRTNATTAETIKYASNALLA